MIHLRQLTIHFAIMSLFATTLAFGDGIPEPGLVMYGSVTNTAGSFALMSGGVQWAASGAGLSATVASTIANVKGQYFYLAHIPFEQRAIPDVTFTPNLPGGVLDSKLPPSPAHL